MKVNKYILIFIFYFVILSARASEDLLYFEAQGIAGYSSLEDEVIYRSGSKYDAMQRSSIGIDYVQKISSETKELGTFALQARLAYDDYQHNAELQIYNAYLKGKSPIGDFWIGHDRIAFGLGSYLDTHGDLLQPLSMYGFGFDRDWGVGFSKDTERGNFKLALTTGSGMPLKINGNKILTSRISHGILNSDNYTVGLSAMFGEILDTMGYKVLNDEPKDVWLVGGDLAVNTYNIEHKFEIAIGEKNSNSTFAGLYRLSFNFLEENKLKLEFQPTYTKKEKDENYILGSGVGYLLNQDITTRFMYEHSNNTNDNRYIFQIYYYFSL